MTAFPFPDGREGAFVHLGFPVYFKVELTVAKILGVLALVIPTVPFKTRAPAASSGGSAAAPSP